MKKVTFKPISTKVLIKRDKAEEKTASGLLYMPEVSQEPPNTGVVLAVGPGSNRRGHGNKHEMTEVKVGDRVIFEIGNGFNFKLDGESYLSIGIRSILGVFEQ